MTSPFTNHRIPELFFESEVHSEALDRLRYAGNDWGSCLTSLIGGVGSGKTTVIEKYISEIKASDHVYVFIKSGYLTFDDILKTILQKFAAEPDLKDFTRFAAISFLKELLSILTSEGRRLFLIIDEAQLLATSDMELLCALTNENDHLEAGLVVILSGQTTLWDQICDLPQLQQRLSLHYCLQGMSQRETDEYIQSRLKSSVTHSSLRFDDFALERIYEFSGGVPRKINQISKIICEFCLAKGISEVDAALVEAVSHDISPEIKQAVLA